MCYFGTLAFFALSALSLFSCSRPRGARQNTRAQVWALADVRCTCSGGSKSHVPTRRHSEHVGPSRPLQTRVQVKRMSDGSCDIWDLECHQCRQAFIAMEKSFYDTNMRPFIFYSISLRPFFSKLIINQPTTNPIASLICEIKSNYLIIDQPSTLPIGILGLVILLIM